MQSIYIYYTANDRINQHRIEKNLMIPLVRGIKIHKKIYTIYCKAIFL